MLQYPIWVKMLFNCGPRRHFNSGAPFDIIMSHCTCSKQDIVLVRKQDIILVHKQDIVLVRKRDAVLVEKQDIGRVQTQDIVPS